MCNVNKSGLILGIAIVVYDTYVLYMRSFVQYKTDAAIQTSVIKNGEMQANPGYCGSRWKLWRKGFGDGL